MKFSSYILFLFLVLLSVQNVDARKRPTSKFDNKRESSIDFPLIEPDPVVRKSRPDSQPRALVKPTLRGGSDSKLVGNSVVGIDVSHYQGTIDWKEVARDPQVKFVFLKMTEGTNFIDNTYSYNLREARKAGLKVGVYHFFRANVSSQAQFENFKNYYDIRQQDLLPIIDVELNNGVGTELFISRLKEFLDLVSKHIGRRPIIYTGKHYYQKYMYSPYFRSYPLMIASYTTNPPELFDGREYIIWQFTSKGRIRGIRGDCDRSCFMGRHNLREIQF